MLSVLGLGLAGQSGEGLAYPRSPSLKESTKEGWLWSEGRSDTQVALPPFLVHSLMCEGVSGVVVDALEECLKVGAKAYHEEFGLEWGEVVRAAKAVCWGVSAGLCWGFLPPIRSGALVAVKIPAFGCSSIGGAVNQLHEEVSGHMCELLSGKWVLDVEHQHKTEGTGGSLDASLRHNQALQILLNQWGAWGARALAVAGGEGAWEGELPLFMSLTVREEWRGVDDGKVAVREVWKPVMDKVAERCAASMSEKVVEEMEEEEEMEEVEAYDVRRAFLRGLQRVVPASFKEARSLYGCMWRVCARRRGWAVDQEEKERLEPIMAAMGSSYEMLKEHYSKAWWKAKGEGKAGEAIGSLMAAIKKHKGAVGGRRIRDHQDLLVSLFGRVK